MSLEEITSYINSIRRTSADQPLDEKEVFSDPFDQFEKWFEEAVNAQILDPFAMILGTVSEIGYPSTRAVYMRDISKDGLTFYTNYLSQKGKEITNNPKVSMIFFWGEIERQIRIFGNAERLTEKQSDEYFASRPRESQIGSWSSDQSEIIQSRTELEEKYEHFNEKFKGLNVPRPENWGGYIVKPEKFEFWQGRPNRLHDRIMYLRNNESDSWDIKRLAP